MVPRSSPRSAPRAPVKRGTQIGTGPAVRQQGVELLRRRQGPDAREPVDRGGGGRDEALERVAGGARAPPGGGGEDAVRRTRGGRPRLGEHERARAERDLGGPGLPAAQAEERGLLVAGRGAHRDALDRGVERVGVDDRRHQGARDAEQVEQLVVPVAAAERAQQRAAGVAGVGDVDAGEPVQQPGGDVAVGQVAVDAVEDRAQLGGGEGGVELEPGALAHPRRVLAQRLAGGIGAAVLPHDRRVHGLPRAAIPDHEGLGLVGDAEHVRPHAGGRDRLARRGDDRLGVLLDQPGRRERALDGHRGGGDLVQLGVEHDAARARRPLVEPGDERHARTTRRSASTAR